MRRSGRLQRQKKKNYTESESPPSSGPSRSPSPMRPLSFSRNGSMTTTSVESRKRSRPAPTNFANLRNVDVLPQNNMSTYNRQVRSMGSVEANRTYVQPAQPHLKMIVNLSFDEIPFFATREVLVPPTLMVGRQSGTENSCTVPFQVPAKYMHLLEQKINGRRRFFIQARFYNDKPYTRQEISYPDYCEVTVDQSKVDLPDHIQVTVNRKKVNRRPPQPVDISAFSRPFNVRHNLSCRWSSSTGLKCVCTIVLVEHVDVNYLKLETMKQPRLFAETKRMIRRVLAEDGDISVDQLKYGRTVMKVPSRSTECDHTQCFDLVNFISVNEKKTKWKCPVCGKDIQYSHVRVDEYFENILRESGGSIQEVELLKDGRWKRVGPDNENMVCLDDSDEEAPAPPAPVAPPVPVPAAPKPEPAVKQQIKDEPAPSTSNGLFKPDPRLNQGEPPAARPTASNNDDVEVITLSDSDDDEPEPPARPPPAKTQRRTPMRDQVMAPQPTPSYYGTSSATPSTTMSTSSAFPPSIPLGTSPFSGHSSSLSEQVAMNYMNSFAAHRAPFVAHQPPPPPPPPPPTTHPAVGFSGFGGGGGYRATWATYEGSRQLPVQPSPPPVSGGDPWNSWRSQAPPTSMTQALSNLVEQELRKQEHRDPSQDREADTSLSNIPLPPIRAPAVPAPRPAANPAADDEDSDVIVLSDSDDGEAEEGELNGTTDPADGLKSNRVREPRLVNGELDRLLNLLRSGPE